mgnify:CR=1 FL=1
MINTELKNQPIVDVDKYTRIGDLPMVIYGAVVKDEYDDQRLVNDQAECYTHAVTDIISNDTIDIYFRAVELRQPLLALKILSDFKKLDSVGDRVLLEYEHLLTKFKVSCNDNLNMVHKGCLPIDGECIKQLADRGSIDVLAYNFHQSEWYNRFSSLGIYILY